MSSLKVDLLYISELKDIQTLLNTGEVSVRLCLEISYYVKGFTFLYMPGRISRTLYSHNFILLEGMISFVYNDYFIYFGFLPKEVNQRILNFAGKSVKVADQSHGIQTASVRKFIVDDNGTIKHELFLDNMFLATNWGDTICDAPAEAPHSASSDLDSVVVYHKKI